MSALHVIKVGSATLDRGAVLAEVAGTARRGARVLLVAGGGTAIRRYHAEVLGRPETMLRLGGGEEVRHCPAEDMPHLVAAYERFVLPAVRTGLRAEGLRVTASFAARDELVVATPNRPLRVSTPRGHRVLRDHRAGTVVSVDVPAITALLDQYDVVCLSPPVAGDDGGLLNVDADMLAARLCRDLDADHLRLVTGTAGLLRDVADPASTIRHLHRGGAGDAARGRMRQKVRAAELALTGTADVAITGPHTMAEPAGWTRWWAAPAPAEDLALLGQAVQIPSVSGDERPLADHLREWCADRGIEAGVDTAGNLVAVRGDGPRRLLLLGHLDTVPHRWPVGWSGGELTGRGSVDAKGCLVAFLETLAAVDVPAGGQLRVVGAVEEEVSSSAGAFHVRDSYPADAVVVGEPSGAGALTLGYFGLLKLRVTATVPVGHSAGRDAVSAPDALIQGLAGIRARVLDRAPAALSAVLDLRCAAGPREATATGTLNVRVPPGAAVDELVAVATGPAAGIRVEVLRATPGHTGGRANPLVAAFGKAFTRAGVSPRHLVKKGTSDMNTLATTWRDVPMVAYGPGDARLDHTDREVLPAAEFRLARSILTDAVQTWLDR